MGNICKEHDAELAAYKPPLAIQTAGPDPAVCLGASQGYFVLEWRGISQAGSPRDWVGLYVNQGDTLNQHAEWRWVTNFQLFESARLNTFVQAGFHARYYRFDQAQWAWVDVKRTGDFPNDTCAT